MSKKSRLKFNLKRGAAELLNSLYYITVVPFLFHNLYKLCRSFFSSPKLLKSSNHFREISDIREKFDIQKGDVGKETKILKKTPLFDESPIKNKFNAHWFAKLQEPNHAIREIVTEGVFRLLSGEEHAAKVRLLKIEKTGSIYSISKLFEGSKTFLGMLKEKKKNSREQLYDFYLKTTENLKGFEEMLVITLLLGRNDCNTANWGVVTKDDGNLAVTFDYGTATRGSPFSIDALLTHGCHSYERIVCEKFLTACETVLEKFEENHDEIVEELLKGIEAAEAVFNWSKVPTANDIMRIFAKNKRQLEHLCYQIRAELAVSRGNPEEFEELIKEVDQAYRFPVLSTQRRDFGLPSYSATYDNKVVHNATFYNFINEGYGRVFSCYSLPPEGEREQNALYLVKTEKYISVHRGGEYCEIGHYKLNQEQAQAIGNLMKFPIKEYEFFEMGDPDVIKEVISICACPLEKPPEIREKLNEVCQKYGIR